MKIKFTLQQTLTPNFIKVHPIGDKTYTQTDRQDVHIMHLIERTDRNTSPDDSTSAALANLAVCAYSKCHGSATTE